MQSLHNAQKSAQIHEYFQYIFMIIIIIYYYSGNNIRGKPPQTLSDSLQYNYYLNLCAQRSQQFLTRFVLL